MSTLAITLRYTTRNEELPHRPGVTHVIILLDTEMKAESVKLLEWYQELTAENDHKHVDVFVKKYK